MTFNGGVAIFVPHLRTFQVTDGIETEMNTGLVRLSQRCPGAKAATLPHVPCRSSGVYGITEML